MMIAPAMPNIDVPNSLSCARPRAPKPDPGEALPVSRRRNVHRQVTDRRASAGYALGLDLIEAGRSRHAKGLLGRETAHLDRRCATQAQRAIGHDRISAQRLAMPKTPVPAVSSPPAAAQPNPSPRGMEVVGIDIPWATGGPKKPEADAVQGQRHTPR